MGEADMQITALEEIRSELFRAYFVLAKYRHAWEMSREYDEEEDAPNQAWHEAYLAHVGIDSSLGRSPEHGESQDQIPLGAAKWIDVARRGVSHTMVEMDPESGTYGDLLHVLRDLDAAKAALTASGLLAVEQERDQLRQNRNAWQGRVPGVYVGDIANITGVCRGCGRALWGGPGGWHDVAGYENCPVIYEGHSFHEPLAAAAPQERANDG